MVRGDDFGIEGEGVWFLGEEERMGRGKRRRKEGLGGIGGKLVEA